MRTQVGILGPGYTPWPLPRWHELVASGSNGLPASCEPGARSGYERGPYSGTVQAWKNCGGDPAASYVTLFCRA